MESRIQKLRRKAAEHQGWRCHYCQQPMWEKDPREFAHRYGLSLPAAARFRCTAEHVVARCDGGQDRPDNIVAACWFCNKARHKAKSPLDAERFAARVQTRVGRQRWHPSMMLAALGQFTDLRHRHDLC